MWVDVGNVVESEEENFVGAEVSAAWMLLSRPKDPHRHCAALPTTDWFGVKKDNQFLDRRFQKRWAAARQLLRLLLLLGEDFHDLLRQGSSSLLTDQEDTLEMVTKGLLIWIRHHYWGRPSLRFLIRHH